MSTELIAKILIFQCFLITHIHVFQECFYKKVLSFRKGLILKDFWDFHFSQSCHFFQNIFFY